MKTDFLSDLGPLGFTARLKRISDAMVHSSRSLYDSLDLDIEPNWYLVFKLLQDEGRLTVTQISERLRFSHPSVISIVSKMKSRNYLFSSTDPSDSRRQYIELSEKAIREMPKLEKVWVASEEAVRDILSGSSEIFPLLEEIEQSIGQSSFAERVQLKLKKENKR